MAVAQTAAAANGNQPRLREHPLYPRGHGCSSSAFCRSTCLTRIDELLLVLWKEEAHHQVGPGVRVF